jgi:uncharacterized membrane-anchored protein
MFQSSPLERKERILSLFDELSPRFQEYALSVIDQLIKLQKDEEKAGNILPKK